MLDLSAFHGAGFDLVYQPISAQYVPDVPAVYRQAAQTFETVATITYSTGTRCRCKCLNTSSGMERRIDSLSSAG